MAFENMLALAYDSHPNARIIPVDFPRAAEILAAYLKKITRATFKLQDHVDVYNNLIIKKADRENPCGFCYYIRDNDLIFEAPNEQAAVYAVYDFLERICGCRFYTSVEEDIPIDANLTVSFARYDYNPPFVVRMTSYRDFHQREFAEKHKMDVRFRYGDDWGLWCHTFDTLVPSDVYFEEHPEYFAYYEGKRLPNSQLCLTNPEVFDVLVENLGKRMQKRPNARYWSVSADDNGYYCRCDKCRELDEREGSPMATVLSFVNKVAERFPDKVISTLSYTHTTKPPKTIRPAKNVNIMLCDYNAWRGFPIETDENASTKRVNGEFREWWDICRETGSSIIIWDYIVQFRGYMAPFPNLDSMWRNYRYFAENGTNMVFAQGNATREGEFSALRGYLMAKMLWDPTLDGNEVIRDFCEHYYGQASGPILSYIEATTQDMRASGGKLSGMGNPKDWDERVWLTEENFFRYKAMMDEALEKARGNHVLTFRVKSAVMPVWYAGIVLGYGSREDRGQWIMDFAAHAKKIGLECVGQDLNVDTFVTDAIGNLSNPEVQIRTGYVGYTRVPTSFDDETAHFFRWLDWKEGDPEESWADRELATKKV